MTKRRRMFEIDVPKESEASSASGELETKSAPARRGPMASAVRETAEAAKDRAETEAAVRAENDRLAHEHVRLKKLGLITDLIPLDAVDVSKLMRDRAPTTDDAELEDLVESIREIGLSNPIRVEPVGERFELIQGWRRLQAYKTLHKETGAEAWARIPAGMVPAGDDLATSYRRMVDENLVRKDISFAEMATLARDYAADPDVPCWSMTEAVGELYASAGYQKRSYIRAFAELLDMLDGVLLHPEAIPRNLGLAVRKQISEGRPGVEDLHQALRVRPNRNAEVELSILRGFSHGQVGDGDLPRGEGRATPSVARKAKTTFRLTGVDGEVRCVAASGKLELRGATDFSSFDRRRLESAVQAFLSALEEVPGASGNDTILGEPGQD
ncbi:MAG: ParB/RepB/Spo0J family partition protein [Paracoccaceae bacterium]